MEYYSPPPSLKMPVPPPSPPPHNVFGRWRSFFHYSCFIYSNSSFSSSSYSTPADTLQIVYIGCGDGRRGGGGGVQDGVGCNFCLHSVGTTSNDGAGKATSSETEEEEASLNNTAYTTQSLLPLGDDGGTDGGHLYLSFEEGGRKCCNSVGGGRWRRRGALRD